MSIPQPNPEATSFVPTGAGMPPPCDPFLDGFSLQFGSMPSSWASSSQMAPVAQMLPNSDSMKSALGSGSSKKRRAWPPPPRFDDLSDCKVTLPSLNQLHYSIQLQVAMSQQIMERLAQVEKSNNKVLDFCHNMMEWSQAVHTTNGEEVDSPPAPKEGEDTMSQT